MLHDIPTHVIAGPLGAGKTTLIRHLLAQRPASERWGVLVNEFGLVGLDAALLARDEDGVAIGEVAGGCVCCVSGVPFQVGLGRLLRKAKPDRLFIEPSGLGHPLQLLDQLKNEPWQNVLTVQPLIMVVDARYLLVDDLLSDAQRRALAACELLVINKSDTVDENTKLLINNELSTVKLAWVEQGRLPLANLPLRSSGVIPQSPVDNQIVDNLHGRPLVVWADPTLPLSMTQQGEGGWSIGWRWHPSQQFYPQAIAAALERLPWRRAKGVIHTAAGWQSFNGLDGSVPAWQPSDWRTDSRIELIFDEPQPEASLQAVFAACQVS